MTYLPWSQLQYADGQTVRQMELESCYIDYLKQGEILFITFEGARDIGNQINYTRKPWGFDFLNNSGFSILGFKPKNGRGWYRESDILEFMNSSDFQNICRNYKKCFFYGGSMGGYAALRFSAQIEKSIVIALQPQTTLDRKIVPQEKRFPESINLNWSGLFSGEFPKDHLADQINVFYDPYLKSDRHHIDLIVHKNLVKYYTPLIGHRVPSAMVELKILKRAVLDIVEGHLTPSIFKKWMKQRSSLITWNLNIASKSRSCKRKQLFIERALELDPKSHMANAAYCRFILDYFPNHENLKKVITISKAFPKAASLAFEIEVNAMLDRTDAARESFQEFELIFNASLQKMLILKHAYTIIALTIKYSMFDEAERLVDACLVIRPTCQFAKKHKNTIINFRNTQKIND